MYLRRLEVLGFKSFRNRVVIEFDPGITVIVGPNGSGKSNLVDALRWVLGEQSARSMRGDKMEDLLFAGSSDSRATGMAEVTAVLEGEVRRCGAEQSYPEEIAITRRLYRSGESEYFINQKRAHLREIQELLWDVGISKDGFSIITQGKVDEVLGAKPEDRRLLLEVAAGIYKHKKRKETALRELDQVNANEVRLRDVISELNGQAEPLRREAKVAMEYRSLRAELAQKRLLLGATRLAKLKATVEDLEKKARDQTSKLKQAELELALAAEEHDKRKQELAAAEKACLQTGERVRQLEGEIERVKSKIRELSGSAEAEERFLKEQDRTYQGLERRLLEIEAEIAGTEAQMRELEQRGAEVAKEETSCLARLAEVEAELKQSESEARNVTSELIEASNQRAQVRHSVAQAEQRKSFLASRLSKLRIEIQEAEKRDRDLGCKVEQLTRKCEQTKGELDELEGQLARLKEQREEVDHNLSVANQSLHVWQDKLKSLEGKVKYLEATLNSGTQAVLKAAQKRILKGILGTVADLFTVDPAYAVAIGAALGNVAENLVTQTVENAKQAIKYLKANKSGWATFVPLERIPSRPEMKVDHRIFDLKEHGAIIDLACNLVTTDSRFSGLCQYVLNNVLVVNDIDDAHQVADTLGYRYKVVTLEGDIIYPGGILRGGSKAKSSSILARRVELRHLLLELSRAQERVAIEEKTCQALGQELARLEEQASYLEKRKLSLESALVQAESLRAAYLEELRPLSQKLEEKRLETSEIMVALKQQEQDIDKTIGRLEELEGQVAGWQARANDLQLETERLRHEHQQLADQRARLEAERRVISERLRTSREVLSKLQEERGSLQGEKSEWTARLKATETSLERNRRQLKLAQDHLQELVLKQQSLVQVEQEEQEHLRACQKWYEEASQQKSKIERQIAKHRERLQLQNLELAEAKATYQAEVRNLCSQFDVNEVQLGELASEPVTAAENLESEISALMASIEALGPVDESSIEQLRRLTERLEFLQVQLSDIVASKNELMELVREIDCYMQQRFQAIFKQINQQFREIFLRLVGGGQAELRWARPDDLLNSGVEILVQLPGKKLQNLLLLSGGERALCSLALMLALVQVQESPFCVLDEVDSSLDGANLERFLSLVQDMANHIQLILISHRQATMQKANYLYGVTMERPGVSKLLSLKLKEGLKDGSARTVSNFPA